jgi:RimJ/RimL family protein N-acetyltransferase
MIEGPRLCLRRFSEDDVPALIRLAGDAGVAAAVGELAPGESGARTYLAEKARYVDFEPGALFDLAIEVRGHGVVGLVSLVRNPADQGEVGYALHAEERGRGYAAEAAGLLIDHAFEVLELHRVFIQAPSGNPASVAVARRLGLRHEGTLVEAAGDDHSDVLVFALLRREWLERRG